MCKWKVVDDMSAGREREGAYEGQTVRLGAPSSTMNTRQSCWGHGRFHWWMLWLLWPLVGLIKGALISLSAAFGAVGGMWTSAAPAILLSVLLIVAGLVLLRRRDTPAETDH